jgi:hypothetical protein
MQGMDKGGRSYNGKIKNEKEKSKIKNRRKKGNKQEKEGYYGHLAFTRLGETILLNVFFKTVSDSVENLLH